MRRDADHQPIKRPAEASRPGVVTLGQMAALFIAAGLTMVEVSCNRCERRGRLSITGLLAEHGPELPGPELRRIIAAECPRMVSGKVHDVCGIHFPQMSRLPPHRYPTPFTNYQPGLAQRASMPTSTPASRSAPTISPRPA
jgi:hypothetical protein